ncbi:hypothetical protein Tco_1330258 [Tanacetum coccineum]
MSRCRQTEYSANGSQFDNRTKGLIIVHTNLLIATISNKASLVPAKGSICKILVLEQPHGTKNVRDSEGCGCQTQHHGRIGKPLLQLLMKHEKELSNLRSSDGAVVAYAWNLLLTEPVLLEYGEHAVLLALKAFTDQKSSSETLDEPPKDHGFHSSRDIRSGSGGVVAPDQIPLL